MLDVVDSPTFAEFSARVRARVEAALDAYCRFGAGCPTRLAEAMRYSLLAPAKRLRPLFVCAAADACGGGIDQAMPAACAVEMVHTYSLIHDDLPAMDDDDLRRGRPTCHMVFGEAMAILAGDALLARAFQILAEGLPLVARECCALLGFAAGPEALVGGQADDLEAEQQAGDLDRLEAIHRRKTGAIFQAALQLGGYSASATPEQLEILRAYGRRVGLAFQIADDLLDVQGDQAALGKRVRKDRNRGKLTYPALIGVEQSRQRADRLVAEAIAELAPLGGAARQMEFLAHYVVERDR